MSKPASDNTANDLFLRRLHAKHETAYKALDAALSLGDAFITATRGMSEESKVTRALFVIFGRLYNSLTTATILLKAGYGVEGGMLTRAFLEAFFNVRYIVNAPEAERAKLADRFFAYIWAADYMNVKARAQAGAKLREGEMREAKEGWKKYWKQHYGWDEIQNRLDWSGLGLAEKAEAGGATKIYKWLNRQFSELVHGGPDAWMHYLEVSPGKVDFRIGPADNHLIDLPVPALSLLLCNVIYDLSTILNLPQLIELADKTAELIQANLPSPIAR